MKRCAIYTRKSSDEGLEQHFNSLDAQRESCEAYVLSQAGEKWRALAARYDDGGYSGGSMERPGLQALLSDVRGGKVDVVVVYKIDRLTRSLADFARIVETFDEAGVSFVSVTQAFNTTSSMGRLTLNVLLSFAQFEREVTGERIRDKIAASKAKGMWMGGLAPLGYDLPANGSRALTINEAEAHIVRQIFSSYLEAGAVHRLREALNSKGIMSKRTTTRTGREVGGLPFSRGALFHLLQNRVYVGEIVHKDKCFDGQHEGIVAPDLFEKVQAMIASHRRERSQAQKEASPLAGKLFDEAGRRLTPTFSRGARGVHYRYYASAGEGPRLRIPAAAIETLLRDIATRVGLGASGESQFARIEVTEGKLRLTLPASLGRTIRRNLDLCMVLQDHPSEAGLLLLEVDAPIALPRSRPTIRATRSYLAKRDPILIQALRTSHAMLASTRRGVPHLERVPRPRYDRRLARLAFLAPDIQQAILAGNQPNGLRLEDLVRNPMPASWREQREWIQSLAG